MSVILLFPTTAVMLLLLCSCATHGTFHQNLPAEASFNVGAGRGDFIFVKVRLKSGPERLFGVDTGMPRTVLDKSLEPELGKCLGTNEGGFVWYGKSGVDFFKSPRLYLGNTPLLTGDCIETLDITNVFYTVNWAPEDAGRRIFGILGMDCLHHYCIQLDFAADKMRFLDSHNLNTKDLGEAFPLSGLPWRMFVDGTLAGTTNANSWIDIGDPNDGALVPSLFDQVLKSQKGIVTKNFTFRTGEPGVAARLPIGIFGGQTYTNLEVLESPDGTDGNIIGLRFLARHLVTCDFPKHTLYLKRENIGPLTNERLD